MVMDMKLQMVDLHGQYLKIKKEVDTGIRQVIETSAFINGLIMFVKQNKGIIFGKNC